VQPLIITPQQAGMRLDRLVATHTGLSRRCARLLISAGRVRVGGRTCRILTRTVNAGAKLSIEAEPQAPTEPAPQAARSAGRAPQHETPHILYQDRWLIAVAKPPGLLSEGDRFGGPCVPTWLASHLRRQDACDKLWLVHRLDAGTSGVLLLARHRGVASALNEIFAQRQAHKHYLALVAGIPQDDAMVLDGPIARVLGTKHGVRPDGKSARTDIATVGVAQNLALVRAAPHTGRSHQIRVHLSHAGHAILGDRLYGGLGYTPEGPGGPRPIPRPMLHAASLRLVHPKTGQQILFEAPVPDDFASLQKRLGL
jgi:23S rRNA pseudouridine1911/1915/1917 synthase